MRCFRCMLAAAAVLALLALSPASGVAQPVARLAWDNCGATGVVTRTFACNTNSGAQQLVVSFVPPAAPAFTGMEARIRFWPPAGSLPAWWAMSAGGCRVTALRSSPFPAGSTPCANPWTSNLFFSTAMDPVTHELRAVVDLNQGEEHPLEAGVEYYGIRITFTHAKSTGAGACDGCSLPVGIYLSRLMLLLGPDPNFEYPLADVPHANWQCDGSPLVFMGQVVGWSFPNCATATRNGTWGGIKALFR